MAAPELRLEVSLGLNTFRSQMRQLVNIAQSEFTAQLNIRFNRRRLDDELNNLRRAIARRTYRIEIGGNLDAVPDKINTLKTRLKELEGTKIDIPVTGIASITKREARSLRAELKRQILAEGGKIKIPVVAEVQTKRGGAGGGFAASSQGAAGLFEYMRTQGMSGGNYPAATQVGRSERLRKALEDLTVKQLQALAKEQGIGGTSKLKKDPLIEKLVTELRQDVAEKILGDIKMQLNEGLRKNLDLVARGIFRMLGIDPQSLREKRLPPAINWQATTPSRAPSIGPSSTGRALPFGAIPGALPGSAFAQQKRLIGNRLDPELKEILRGAANTFVDSVRAELNAAVRSVSVRDLGNTMRAALSPKRIAGLLPAGVGRTPSVYASAGGEDRSQLFARRTAEAYARSAMRGVDVMAEGRGGGPARPYSYAYRSPRPQGAIVPYERGAIVPAPAAVQSVQRAASPNPFSGMGRATAGAIGRLNLPGAGAIREFGDEFKYATQQVLLFGTAYKALAFLTDFPRQVGAAVGALQAFNNSLKAISPSAEEARASNEMILDLVDKYNIPLQSARDGFVKLYASMQPAGFNGDEIRQLFEGISKAAATYGMSADKVDRVTYAFAQMASKGQVMSEELKGQLGDVLPGAMAIFAEAAGFKGPDAISKFSAALEDGAYKGQAMTVLLKNVTMVMNKEFGAGAEGAALTFQGVMNRMQNSLTLLYESFEPVAVGFLNSVVMPLTSGIKTITDGLNAFFTDTTAQTRGGFALAQELEKLRPAFEGIQRNVQQLIPVFQQFGRIALQVGQILLQIAGNPFVGYLARVYAITLPLTLAFQALNLRALVPLIANFLRAIPAFASFNAAAATGVSTNKALQIAMYNTGQAAGVTAAQVRTVSVALKAAFASTVVLAIVAGIGMIIERIVTLGARMDDIKQKAMGASQAIRMMSQSEARQAENQAATDVKLLQSLSQREQIAGRKGYVAVNKSEQAALERAGIGTITAATRSRGPQGFTQAVDITRLRGAIEQRQGILREAQYRQRQIKYDEQQAAAPVITAPIPPSGEEDKKKEKEKKRYVSELAKALQKEMEIQINKINQDASLSDREREIKAASTRYQYEMLINKAEYNAGINDENKKDILNRQGYLADLKKTFDQENELSRQRFEDVVTKPLRDALDEDRKAVVQLEAENKSLADGKTELTKVEERQVVIKQALVGLEEDQIKTLQPLIDLVLQQAAAVDKLTASQKALKAEKGIAKTIQDLQIEAGIISPSQARRIEQRRKFEDQIQSARESGASPEQIARLQQAQAAVPIAGSLEEQIGKIKEALMDLLSAQEMVKGAAEKIGDSFAQSFKDIIGGSQTAQQALASFFQRIGDYFLDMVARMVSAWLQTQLIKGLGNLFSLFAPAVGGSLVKGVDVPVAQMPAGMAFANGGIAPGGFIPFRKFATGGTVSGPTLGLVGEGRYNEAVVPLPDGKSIPVELGGAAGNQIVSNITVNVNNGQTQSNATGANSSELGRKLEGAVKQVIVGELRPGGLLSR